MSYQLTNLSGAVEAVIDDNCGISKFNNIINMLLHELRVKFLNKVDDSDTVDWHFKYKGHPLTLHYNIYNGVSVFAQNRKNNRAVDEIAKYLERKVF
ncbi:MAG: DUF3630 family protein [Chitinophagaceae bacterium]|nr:DUF3630 family protein [Chitinophagaceae bacterium]MCW5904084.1 DUF3630 family protein [Chitinophagaceae bacterium]